MDNLKTPAEIAAQLVLRIRELRLSRNWTQDELADRAGITVASYRRFEQTGKISLERLLLLASALGALDSFAALFPISVYSSLDAVEAAAETASVKKPRARRGDLR